MRLAFTLLFALVASGLVSGTLAVAMAEMFRLNEAFILVLMFIPVACLVSLLVLGIVQGIAEAPAVIDRAAMGLGVAVLVVMGYLAFRAYGSGASAAAILNDLPFVAAFVLPAFVAIGVQWWLVRRYWLVAYGGSAV